MSKQNSAALVLMMVGMMFIMFHVGRLYEIEHGERGRWDYKLAIDNANGGTAELKCLRTGDEHKFAFESLEYMLVKLNE